MQNGKWGYAPHLRLHKPLACIKKKRKRTMNLNLKKLKESPIYNLSLSSKELFHSNFLYWLANTYEKEFGELFIEFCKVKPSKSDIKNIKREKGKIDLSFMYSDNCEEILIENKVKSIPDLTQLKKYSQKEKENQNYVLLSLSEPVFFKGKDKLVVDSVTWFYLSYDKLNKKLSRLCERLTNSYHKEILQDYQFFISELIKIDTLCNLKLTDKFIFHSDKVDFILSDLSEIRFNDFYLKKKYELFAYLFHNHLKKSVTNVLDFKEEINWKNDNEEIYIGCGMTRGMGLFDVKYKIISGLVLGIQIQGEHYRMVVEGKNANHISEILLEHSLWFNLEESFPNNKLYPIGDKQFNKYGSTFFYKSVKLGVDKNIKEIIELITKDIRQVSINKVQIRKMITQANTG